MFSRIPASCFAFIGFQIQRFKSVKSDMSFYQSATRTKMKASLSIAFWSWVNEINFISWNNVLKIYEY